MGNEPLYLEIRWHYMKMLYKVFLPFAPLILPHKIGFMMKLVKNDQLGNIHSCLQNNII